jgi:uncharacterized membrane protein YfcA
LLPIIGVGSEIITISTIATSLLASLFTTSSSFVNHYKKKNVFIKEGIILGPGALVSAAVAPKVAVNLDPAILKIVIAFFIFIAAVKLISQNDKKEKVYRDINSNWLFPFGLLFGGLASISGLGGGVFYVPILLYFLRGNIRLAVGTSSLVILFTMASSSVSFLFLNTDWNGEIFQLGYINVASAVLLGIGAMFGAYLGVKLIFKVPLPIFRKIFSLFLFFVVLKILQGI